VEDGHGGDRQMQQCPATCSVACSTSTGELHECVCAPFEVIDKPESVTVAA
jgi:hypothetical protein